ncbi:RNA recognition motif domain [Macleaya cordata]|uniref:RNA recognition motif domain n=1 Tax=Macleaya cordata TaxID=56857 RepID=A0A200QLQ0_MACCD|nr:RNA recognition motif domain [Macleaya cordata]
MAALPNHLDMNPHIHHHHHHPPPPHQNRILLPPPSQSSLIYPPPLADSVFSPAAIHHHPPYDPNYVHQQQNFGHSEKNNIHTLFVSGLPDDVKPREIHNLFRRRQGFDFCQLKYTGRGNQVVAFATFFNHQSAMAAMNSLNGITFDPQSGDCLHIELARSNSRTKRSRGAGGYFVIDKRVKVSTDEQEISSNDGDDGSDEPSGTDNPDSSNKGDLATAESIQLNIFFFPLTTLKEQPENTVAGELPPCSTLFIANLGPNCTEEELKQALSQYPGFHIVKMRAKRGMPVAFADFENVENANEAMQSLQGSMLPSSDRGGLHLEYARSKMRKP